jgi:hypothetical protein
MSKQPEQVLEEQLVKKLQSAKQRKKGLFQKLFC